MKPQEQSILAAELLGWKKIPLPKSMNWGQDAGPDKQWWYIHQLPNFTTDANASLLLVEWMRERGREFKCDLETGCMWHVYFTKEITHHFSAETFPLAVLHAFLRANGKEVA